MRVETQWLRSYQSTLRGARLLQQLDEFEAFVEVHPVGVTEYYESLVRKLIEKITVYDDHMKFEFKSGLQTDVMA